jgi:Mrp family chromosome partitioning ATPase
LLWQALGDSFMVDLTSEMAQLWSSLGPPATGGARVIQFAGAIAGEGTSTVAREFARFAASRARRPVWLIDLDLASNSQHRAVASEPGRFGPLGRQTAASPDGSMFFTIQPPGKGPDGQAWPDARYLVAYPVAGGRLWVTRFRGEALAAGQRPRLLPTGDYWTALRRHAELVVIDSPPADGDQAEAGLAVAPFADATILVVSAERADASGPAALKAAIARAGGRCAGLVFNRATIEPPGFLKGLLP